MEAGSGSPSVQIHQTYEKTSCYFCNDWLEPQAFKEHIIHCGQVLEKCPNSCTSYVQRKRMRSHLKECPKTDKDAKSLSPKNGDLQDYENQMLVLQQDVSALRSVLNEEIKQRLHLITDVGSLRKHNQISDEWTHKVGDVLSALKKCINEEASTRTSELKKCNEDVGKLFSQYQQLIDWQSNVTMRIDKLHNRIIQNENSNQAGPSSSVDGGVTPENSEKIQYEIDEIHERITKLRYDFTDGCNFLTDKIRSIEQYFEDRTMNLESKMGELEDVINAMNADLQTKFVVNADLNSKQMTLDLEVKSMKNIVCETEEKCDKLERIVADSNRFVFQTKQGLADLETHLMYQKKLMGIHNTRGHLIWKIDNFSHKMIEAKEFDTSIQGPMFCNKLYGYTLRLDVHLNGIGNWRGRNLIACVTVVPGEYDSLLQWPCKLQADIVLRDQPKDLADSVDYIKTTLVKKKHEDYHNNQYIHIPHKIIDSRHYIRNDAIILEVRVKKSGTTALSSTAGPSQQRSYI